MSDFLELAEERYSARKFEDRPVNEIDLEKIIEAAGLGSGTCWANLHSNSTSDRAFDLPGNTASRSRSLSCEVFLSSPGAISADRSDLRDAASGVLPRFRSTAILLIAAEDRQGVPQGCITSSESSLADPSSLAV